MFFKGEIFIDFGKPFPKEGGENETHLSTINLFGSPIVILVTDGSRLAESKYSKIHVRGKFLISIPRTELICVIT